jgi:hypothetical protein
MDGPPACKGIAHRVLGALPSLTWVRQAANAGLAGGVLRAGRIWGPHALRRGHHRRQQHLCMHVYTHQRCLALSRT